MGARSRGCEKAHAATSRSPIEKTKFGRSFESWPVLCSAPAPSLAWRNSSSDSMSCRASPISSSPSRSEDHPSVSSSELTVVPAYYLLRDDPEYHALRRAGQRSWLNHEAHRLLGGE